MIFNLPWKETHCSSLRLFKSYFRKLAIHQALIEFAFITLMQENFLLSYLPKIDSRPFVIHYNHYPFSKGTV